jgi:hypothetical protein
MTLTPIGLILIPLSVGTFLFRPDYLGPLAIILSAFQAASVLNIDGSFPIGLTPYFLVLILIAIRFVPLWLSGKCSFKRSDAAIAITQPLWILAIWAVASSFLLPWLFAGVGVDVPRAGMDSPETSPLRWTMSNAAQAGYVALDAIFVVYLLWCGRTRGYFERLIRAFVFAGLIAASVGAYQYVAHYSGLPYPATFFNSNPGWRQLLSEEFSGVWRLSATFSEPSAAGSFFAVWSTLLLFLAAGGRVGGWAWPLFALGVLMLFLTTSTTGYITGALVIALFIQREFGRVLTSGRVSGRSLFALLLIIGAAAIALIYVPDLRGLLAKIVWHKTQSQSGHDRTTTIWEALRITAETYGMGAGLGSNRPSGMFFYIASNLGIPGLIAFSVLIWSIYRILGLASRSSVARNPTTTYLQAVGWATAIELIAMASAGGDISGALLWVCIALTATGGRAVWLRSQDMLDPIELPESCRIGAESTVIVLLKEYSIS